MFNFFKKKTKSKETSEKKLGYPTGPVLGQKGFVNEKVCDADIKKYKLQEIRPINQRDLDKGYSYYQWTIDREREIWFLYQKSEESNLDGYNVQDPEYLTGNGIYILHYKGENIEVVLKKHYRKDRPQKLVENPYYIIWELIRINKPENLKDASDEEIIILLKEALSMYGSDNILTSVPQENIIVQFKF